MREACAMAGVDYALNPGEGAFYGPKLEFVLRDAIGRDVAVRHACRSISTCPTGSAPNTWARTARATSR